MTGRPTLPAAVPVLVRAEGLQVGLSPAVLLPDPPAGAVAALARLDGSSRLAAVAAQTGAPLAWLDAAVRRLDAAGLLAAPERPRLAVIGSGRLARCAARAGVERGWRVALVTDPLGGEPPEPFLGAAPGRWQAADAVIVAVDRASPDRVLADELLRADVEHVYCHGSQSGASVGPLVRPGRTACLRCLDLSLAAREPQWPLLAAQLARRAFDVDPAAAAWAAGLAVAQLGAEEAACVDATVELHGATISQRRWRRHPECGCADPTAWAA